MSIELRTMRYVIAIAETGGFQRAAERLHMSQPPLSRQIRELERELGVALFHRRPTRLTAEGHIFVKHARAVLANVDRALAETRAAAGAHAGVVRIGAGPMSGSTDIPRIVAAVNRRYPDITLEVVEMWDTELASALIAGDVDIAIGWHLGIDGEPIRRVLRREPYAVVVGDGHRLADRPRVALAELRGETFRFLARRFAPNYYDAVLRVVGSTGEDFTVWENPLPGLRYFGTLGAGGFNLLPTSISRSLPAGIRCLQIADDLPPAELVMAWRSGAGQAVEAVASVATKAARRPPSAAL
ncbi:MAG TPA: LysR substrate-binding domain-containing protein [Mycobacterium sp.]|nr:LysR substrate-binding domain-containing protein [Mycobacterium sp.]